MRIYVFAGRNSKEMVRDPMSIVMGIGSPVALIALMSFIMRNTDGMVEIFQIQQFAPSMTVFSLSFLSLFLGALMVTDRNTSYLMRLLSSPMKGYDYILGYSIPVLPLGLAQILACFLVATIFGLEITKNILLAALVLVPSVILFIGFGLLMGSVFNNNGLVSGFGTVVIGASIFLSGGMIPLKVIGGNLEKICYLLPFAHMNDAVKNTLTGNYEKTFLNLRWIIGYSVVVFIVSSIVFKKRSKH